MGDVRQEQGWGCLHLPKFIAELWQYYVLEYLLEYYESIRV